MEKEETIVSLLLLHGHYHWYHGSKHPYRLYFIGWKLKTEMNIFSQNYLIKSLKIIYLYLDLKKRILDTFLLAKIILQGL